MARAYSLPRKISSSSRSRCPSVWILGSEAVNEIISSATAIISTSRTYPCSPDGSVLRAAVLLRHGKLKGLLSCRILNFDHRGRDFQNLVSRRESFVLMHDIDVVRLIRHRRFANSSGFFHKTDSFDGR